MPVVKFERVISCSSEDKNFAAENLLSTESYKKWKCLVSKDSQAVVILQLERPSVIQGIDIGNENSAFVEVLVGRSTSVDDFEVLLVSSSLMSPMEGRIGINKNRVRFFSKEHLSKPAVDKKWDRLKIVCTQPFNKNAPYGLSFITVHTGDDKIDHITPASTLGRFAFKSDDDTESLSVGSLFARRKEMADEEASKGTGSTGVEECLPTLPALKINPARGGRLLTELADDTSRTGWLENSCTDLSLPIVIENPVHGRQLLPTVDVKVPKKAATNGTVTKRPFDQTSSSSRVKRTKSTDKIIARREFGKLLNGVVLVISGYQNPHRANLRSMALDMGARYTSDWEASSTHLICAFRNTPKFQQVRGKGHIVRKEWIEDCHSRRRRLPWRRYALDKQDQTQAESEEEVLEDSPQHTAVRSDTPIDSSDSELDYLTWAARANSGSDTEEEVERIKASKNSNNTAADSCVESKPEAELLPWPLLGEFFGGYTFCIHSDFNPSEIRKIKRSIVAFDGYVFENLNDQVKYFVIPKGTDVKRIKTAYPQVLLVTPAWIQRCCSKKKMLPLES